MAEFNPLTADATLKQLAGNEEQNPLRKYFRQPKVHITLPSKGKYYPEGALNTPETGEYAVYAMTAKDELSIKTPDALLNGSATVSVIKSCIPDIIDPWQMPSIDLDAVLVAIRIATYGEILELVTAHYEDTVVMGEMTVGLRPLTYKEFTSAALKTFEEQRIFQTINDDSIPDAEKLTAFSDSFAMLTDLTVSMLAKGVIKVTIGDTEVTNPDHISEFISNVDKEFYQTILDHLDAQKQKFGIEPFKVDSSDDDVAAGAPKTFEVPITFDQSNFFA
jgi:hypothetical protein